MDELKMKPSRIVMGPASLELNYSGIVPIEDRHRVLEITELLTPPQERGNNHANSLMNEVCDQADQQGILLMLIPESFGKDGLSTEQLERWYIKNFGFLHLQKEPKTILVRMPRTAAQQWASNEQQ